MARLLPKANSFNPAQEMQLRLPPPFKVKNLLPKVGNGKLPTLPHYNQELTGALEGKRIPSYSPVRLPGRQSELYS